MIEQALILSFPLFMIWAAGSDLMTMTIPNRLSLLLVAGFLIFALVSGLSLEFLFRHLTAGAIVLVVGFLFFVAGWMGGGDVKLATATAIWFGLSPLLDYFAFSALVGGLLTLLILLMRRMPLPSFAMGWAWLRRLHDPSNGVPYGIALAAAALIVFPQIPFVTAALAR